MACPRLLGAALFRGLARLGSGGDSSVGDESVRRLFRNLLPMVSNFLSPGILELNVEDASVALTVRWPSGNKSASYTSRKKHYVLQIQTFSVSS